MSTTGKAGAGLLSTLANPATRKIPGAPIEVPPEAEQAFGLASPPDPALAATVPPPAPVASAPPPVQAPANRSFPAGEPEKSKTFFLPYSMCERLEMQKLSERREMKHIVRQALEEYFERTPLRPSVRELYRE